MGKIKREIAFPYKIQMMDHKTWQVPWFRISKALIFIVIDILSKKFKIRVVGPCYDCYQNLEYLIK